MDHDAVADAIRAAEAEAIAPRHQALIEGDVTAKDSGEMVTVADRECERLLIDSLRSIDDVPVVGEEGVDDDPSLLRHLDAGDCWLVDPLDGTKNFAAGYTGYAVMVARITGGAATSAWIWIPRHDTMAIAEAGAGAFLDGERVTLAVPDPDPMSWTSIVKTRYVPTEDLPTVRRFAESVGNPSGGIGCAGAEYVLLGRGDYDLLVYWRTLPWDHAPGALYAVEAGARACRPDGSTYHPADDRKGLLVGAHADAALWQRGTGGH